MNVCPVIALQNLKSCLACKTWCDDVNHSKEIWHLETPIDSRITLDYWTCANFCQQTLDFLMKICSVREHSAKTSNIEFAIQLSIRITKNRAMPFGDFSFLGFPFVDFLRRRLFVHFSGSLEIAALELFHDNC